MKFLGVPTGVIIIVAVWGVIAVTTRRSFRLHVEQRLEHQGL